MFYLINPGGRIVQMNKQEEFDLWKDKEGFRIPTQAVIDDFQQERIHALQEMERSAQLDHNQNSGLYFATVTQGNKDGYGVSSGNILKELRKLGVNASTRYDQQRVAILFHNPYSITRIESPYRIIYTMFESDKIPDDWHDYLEAANVVLVPSRWCQEIFAKAGIKTTVVPLGYDHSVYSYKERYNKRDAHEPFVFLHYNAFNIRKGFLEVFKAFTKEFKKDEPVKLVLKTTLDNPYQHFPIPLSNYPNIEVITGTVEDLKMQEICQNADCFLFPSRGEGFGMTPLEAMATGLPTIVPNAHGISEYFDSNFMYEVNVKEKCVGHYSRYKGKTVEETRAIVGDMVVCDVDHLASQMRYVYEHEKEAKQKGKLASEYVKRWTYENTAKQLKSIVDDILSKPIPDNPVRNILPLEKVS